MEGGETQKGIYVCLSVFVCVAVHVQSSVSVPVHIFPSVSIYMCDCGSGIL